MTVVGSGLLDQTDVTAQQAAGFAELFEIGGCGRAGDCNQAVTRFGDLVEVCSALLRSLLATHEVRRAGNRIRMHDAYADVLQRQELRGRGPEVVDRVGPPIDAEGAADRKDNGQHDGNRTQQGEPRRR